MELSCLCRRKLSDLDEDGHLTFKEFTVAMHLLFIAKLGYYLPVDLDPNTILPPSVSVETDCWLDVLQFSSSKINFPDLIRARLRKIFSCKTLSQQ